MPTFTPPTDLQVGPITDYFGNTPADAEKSALGLAAHFRPGPRGRNVYLMNDGSVTEQQPANWNGSTFAGVGPNVAAQGPYATSYTYAGGVNPPDGVTRFFSPPSQQVKRIFWGGCANPITSAEATILTAAGYGANIT